MIQIKIYEILIAELGTYVKFKVLDTPQVESFMADLLDVDVEDRQKIILEHVVFNMRTEIRESLKSMSKDTAAATLNALYHGCIMLNPGFDIEEWVKLSFSGGEKESNIAVKGIIFNNEEDDLNSDIVVSQTKKTRLKKITKAKFLNLQRYLEDRVIGQDEAIGTIVNALKRSQVGLSDEGRPLGVFLFSGSSGVGKTFLALELHRYLYGDDKDLVRIDCGEYQHKHDNQKLTGSPPGYTGHDEGGQLANAVKNNPNTVVLLDEVEKAHPDIWNTFLRVFDEGILTDSKGQRIDFRNTVIIMTTNLGNEKVVEQLTSTGLGFTATRLSTALGTKIVPNRELVERAVNESVKKLFRPEFLNRIDQNVVFNYLLPDDYIKIADLEIQKIEEKLSKRGIVLKWDDRVLELLVNKGVDSIRGARGITQIRREKIEDLLADKLLSHKIVRGTIIELSVYEDNFAAAVIGPTKMLEMGE